MCRRLLAIVLNDSARSATSPWDVAWISWSSRPAAMLRVASTISPIGRVMLRIIT